MQDAWRAYMELALGLKEASQKKAEKVAKQMVGKGGAKAAQLQSFAEELVTTSRANREALAKLVRFEVERAVGVVGLATADEVGDLRGRVRDLERELREATARAAAAEAAAEASVTTAAAAAAAANQPSATSAPAKKAAAKQTTAGKAAKKTAAKKTAAKKTPAKQTGSAAPRKSAPGRRAEQP